MYGKSGLISKQEARRCRKMTDPRPAYLWFIGLTKSFSVQLIFYRTFVIEFVLLVMRAHI